MRKLPVFDAIGHAITSTFKNFPFAFHVSWPWMLVIMPLSVATNLYVLFNDLAFERGSNPQPGQTAQYFLAVLPLVVVNVLAYSAIAVSWHRYILLDEVPQGWARLRLDRPMWRYIGNFLLILLILLGCGVAAGIGVGIAALLVRMILGETVMTILIVPVAIAGYIYGIISMYRMLVKLPAVALGREDFTIADAWFSTRGNQMRLFGMLVVTVCLSLAVGTTMLAAVYVFNLFGTIGLSISIAFQVLVNWALTIFGVTILTSLYGFFVQDRNF
jgi:hypothetical protein